MKSGHVILSHGLESGPNATKVTRLAGVAEALGWSTERPDYGQLRDPQARIQLLLARCAAVTAQPVVLVGSSMGAYISAIATLRVAIHGVFLLAPPVGWPGAEALEIRCAKVCLIHGWDDELIPADSVYQFARPRKLPLQLLPDDHRLSASVDDICASFKQFLQECVSDD